MQYTIKEAREAILKACRQMKEEGLIVRTWGNVSARLSRDEFLITPSGRDYDTMQGEDLVLVNIRNLKYDGKYKPSSEKAMHARIYDRRPECGFIVHTHQLNASAVSLLGEDIMLDEYLGKASISDPGEAVVTEEEYAKLGKVIPCASYGLSSTKRLAKNIAKSVAKYPGARAVLMRCHGAVLFGSDEERAMEQARVLERVCGKIYEKKCGEAIAAESGEEYGKELAGGSFLHTRTPYVLEMSRRAKTLLPYLDDAAQILGLRTLCIETSACEEDIKKALTGRAAVLIKGDGAVCVGRDAEEARATALVLEKNCMAANLALKKALDPVPKLGARIERRFYIRKYASL